VPALPVTGAHVNAVVPTFAAEALAAAKALSARARSTAMPTADLRLLIFLSLFVDVLA
jgi:hypothetical protein